MGIMREGQRKSVAKSLRETNLPNTEKNVTTQHLVPQSYFIDLFFVLCLPKALAIYRLEKPPHAENRRKIGKKLEKKTEQK